MDPLFCGSPAVRYSSHGRASARKSMALDAAIARVTLPATAANLRAATELDEHSDDAWATAVAVAAMSQELLELGADRPAKRKLLLRTSATV